MAIHLDIITHLDRRRQQADAAQIKRDFETFGGNAADAWAKGFEANSPRMRRAWANIAKATEAATASQDKYARAVRNTRQVAQRQALALQHSAEKLFDLEERHRQSMEKTQKAEEKHAKSSQRLGTRRSREYIKAAREQIAASRKVDEQLRNQQRLVNEIAAAEEELAARKMSRATKDLDADSVKGAKDRLAIDKQVAVLEKRIIKLFEDKEKSLGAITDAEGRYNDTQQKREELTHRLTAAERENLQLLDQRNRAQHQEGRDQLSLNRARRDAAALHRDTAYAAARAQEAEGDAFRRSERDVRNHTLALKGATDAVDEHSRALGRMGGSNRGALSYLSKNLGALTPLGTVSPGVLLPLVAILGSVGEAVVTASQSLALLPAVATAAGAGIGTLAIATHGFGQTIKDMGDPKKFAEGLQTLSPNAQQAALEIKALVDGPLGELKTATQDAFFANIPEQLHNLANVFGPTVQNMTVGIATAFNDMMNNLANQLMTPDMQGRIGEITNNIVTMFKSLEPAMGPFVDAFTRITQVGAGFLPGLADSIARVATSFDDFITRVQESGQLRDFIQHGIDAVKALGGFLFDLGRDIYDTFGNKSPEEFRDLLDQVKGVVKAVADAIVGVSHVINDLMPVVQGVVDTFGGWTTVLETWVGLWATWKTLKVAFEVGQLMSAMGSLSAATVAAETATAIGTAGSVAIAGGAGALGIAGTVGTGLLGMAGAALIAAGAFYLLKQGMSAPNPNFPNTKTRIPVQNLPGVRTRMDAPPSPGKKPWTPGTPVTQDTEGAEVVPGKNEYYIPGVANSDGSPAAGPYSDQNYTGPTDFAGPFDPDKPVPGVPGPAPSQTDQLHAIMEGLDPSLYQVDPYQGMTTGGPSGPSMYGQSSLLVDSGHATTAPALQSLAADLEQRFPGITSIGGSRDTNTAPGTHDTGTSIDVGIGNNMSLGDAIREYVGQVAGQYGLKYAIWRNLGTDFGTGATFDQPGHMDHVDIHAAPGQVGPVGPQYNVFGQQTGFGANVVDPQEVQRADYDVQRTARELSQSKQELLAKEKSGLYDAIELQEGRDEVADKEQAWREAQQKLAEAQMGNFEKYKTSANGMSKDMQQIGAELDKDFGISKGLPGIAENLTKFLANLAFAPVLGALSAVTAAYGTAGQGTGLLGMLAPRTNAFGQPMPNILGQYADEQGNLLPPGVMPQQAGGQQPGMPGQPGPASNPANWGANWEAISQKESGGNWGITYGQGAADNPVTGGLQIGDATWRDNGGLAYGVEHAYQAPREAQIAVAENILRSQGPGAWPDTFVPAGPPPGPYTGQAGGTVPGFGNGDKVPALLEPGELVVPRDDVSNVAYMDPNDKRWFPWMPSQSGDRRNRRGVMGLDEGGYLDQQGNWHPYDPNEGRTEPNAGAGLEPPKAPPHLPFGTGPGQIPFAVAPANRKGIPKAPAYPGTTPAEGPYPGNPIPPRPFDTPGPFGLLPGQTTPGEHQTYIPGQPMPGHPLPMEPGGVLHPLPPRTVEELPTKPAGRYPGQGLNVPHGQGVKPGGGIIGLAESAAVSAAGMAGGLGSFGAGGAAAAALAQIGIDEINRAIQYGGQVAGIAVQGLMETFLPNESPLADIGGGWVGRIASAAAGASAGTANIAGAIGSMLQQKPGEKDQKQPAPGEQVPPPGDQAPPGTPASGIGLGPPPGPVTTNNNVNITAANANPNEIANVATQHLMAMYAGPGG